MRQVVRAGATDFVSSSQQEFVSFGVGIFERIRTASRPSAIPSTSPSPPHRTLGKTPARDRCRLRRSIAVRPKHRLCVANRPSVLLREPSKIPGRPRKPRPVREVAVEPVSNLWLRLFLVGDRPLGRKGDALGLRQSSKPTKRQNCSFDSLICLQILRRRFGLVLRTI